MGFWDKQMRQRGMGAPPRPPQPAQAPPRQGWPPAAPQYQQQPALQGHQEPAASGYEPEGEITPETHPWAFQMGPDGRPRRSPFTWKGGAAAKTDSHCPECGSGNYIEPQGQDDGWHGGTGATTAGITRKDGARALPGARCLDCGFPKLQQGSGAALSGSVKGMAPGAGAGNFIPAGSVKVFDPGSRGYVPIGG